MIDIIHNTFQLMKYEPICKVCSKLIKGVRNARLYLMLMAIVQWKLKGRGLDQRCLPDSFLHSLSCHNLFLMKLSCTLRKLEC
jgi:hypothetical protein